MSDRPLPGTRLVEIHPRDSEAGYDQVEQVAAALTSECGCGVDDNHRQMALAALEALRSQDADVTAGAEE